MESTADRRLEVAGLQGDGIVAARKLFQHFSPLQCKVECDANGKALGDGFVDFVNGLGKASALEKDGKFQSWCNGHARISPDMPPPISETREAHNLITHEGYNPLKHMFRTEADTGSMASIISGSKRRRSKFAKEQKTKLDEELGKDVTGNPDCTIFVGAIPQTCSEEKLLAYFKRHCAVQKLTLKKDPQSGKSRGFGFVEFVDPHTRKRVLETEMHKIEGKGIDVRLARFNDMPGKVKRSRLLGLS